MTSSIAPVTNKEKAGHEAQSVNDITDHSLQPPNMLVKYTDFDVAEDKCTSYFLFLHVLFDFFVN